MTDHSVYDEINESKADMDHIYNQPDPRAYFRELKRLSYAIPGYAKPIFQAVISQLRKQRGEPLQICDLGCSYGVNAALLKYDLSMAALYAHWSQRALDGATPKQVVENDRKFFADLDQNQNISVIGLDQAENAVFFAEDAGLLDQGIAANLEEEPLPPRLRGDLAPVDLVTSTGCVGYVTERTFERLLPAISGNGAPWFANFVLRMFPFDAIEQALDAHGFVTEKLAGRTFIQRRFASAEEQAQVLEHLRAQGIEPIREETDGYLVAEFYLSRPMKDAAELPLEQLLAA